MMAGPYFLMMSAYTMMLKHSSSVSAAFRPVMVSYTVVSTVTMPSSVLPLLYTDFVKLGSWLQVVAGVLVSHFGLAAAGSCIHLCRHCNFLDEASSLKLMEEWYYVAFWVAVYSLHSCNL